MSRQPGQDYPDILLERYLAGDLAEELRAELERACDRSEILRRRLDELERDRSAFLAADPPEQFAHRLAAELQFDSEPARTRRRPWLVWLLAPSAGAAAAALMVTVVALQSDRSHLAMAPPPAGMAPQPEMTATPAAEMAATPAADPEMPLEARADKDSAPGQPVMREPLGLAKKPTARPPASKKPKKKRRLGAGGGGGGRAVDSLFDSVAAPAVAPPPPRPTPPKSASEPAPATEVATPDRAAGPSRKSLARSDIMAGVKKGTPAVMKCIKRAREAGEIAAGRHTLVLSWTIEPSGSVSSPKLVGPSDVVGTSLPACFVRGMRKWRFPQSASSTPVRNFPFGPFSIR